MCEQNKKQDGFESRRKFMQTSALAGKGLMFAGPLNLFGNQTEKTDKMENIKSKGFAARDESGKLSPWEFERRSVGENDILIEIKYCGICHSDIHQERGHWGEQQYPQVPGHEIAGIVAAVGKNVTKFKKGDKAGVGCMVDSCMECESCKNGEEQYCDRGETRFTYGYPDEKSPTEITQGGYASNIVVKEHFAIQIPESIPLQYAAPLLCAGITTYSPLMKADFNRGDKVGVDGIGGLGHMAIKLAVAKGAEVYAFTTTSEKIDDILSFGAKEAIVVDSLDKLHPYYGTLDYMISTIPYDFDIATYSMLLQPYKEFVQVGVPIGGKITMNSFITHRSRAKISTSLIGGIPETQEIMNYCVANKIYPQIEAINSGEINKAWDKVVNKEARYRYVIDAATF
ncbi:MAG: NAD(P)-dependent alcohol dehydrogenase [Anditalea sp.]